MSKIENDSDTKLFRFNKKMFLKLVPDEEQDKSYAYGKVVTQIYIEEKADPGAEFKRLKDEETKTELRRNLQIDDNYEQKKLREIEEERAREIEDKKRNTRNNEIVIMLKAYLEKYDNITRNQRDIIDLINYVDNNVMEKYDIKDIKNGLDSTISQYEDKKKNKEISKYQEAVKLFDNNEDVKKGKEYADKQIEDLLESVSSENNSEKLNQKIEIFKNKNNPDNNSDDNNVVNLDNMIELAQKNIKQDKNNSAILLHFMKEKAVQDNAAAEGAYAAEAKAKLIQMENASKLVYLGYKLLKKNIKLYGGTNKGGDTWEQAVNLAERLSPYKKSTDTGNPERFNRLKTDVVNIDEKIRILNNLKGVENTREKYDERLNSIERRVEYKEEYKDIIEKYITKSSGKVKPDGLHMFNVYFNREMLKTEQKKIAEEIKYINDKLIENPGIDEDILKENGFIKTDGHKAIKLINELIDNVKKDLKNNLLEEHPATVLPSPPSPP